MALVSLKEVTEFNLADRLLCPSNTCNLNLDEKVRKPNNNGSFKVII